jgi:hypothetical protein
MRFATLLCVQENSIQSQGGKARAEKLSKPELQEIAKKAAETRWANRPLKAIYKGNFKEHFGIDVDCYVLDDANKTAVLSLRGLSRALGFPDDSGSRLKSFLSAKKMAPFAGEKMHSKLSQPIVFQWGSGGKNPVPGGIHGFDASALIDICNVILEAQKAGVGGVRFDRVARSASIITSASAKAGIRNLVYAIAGYNPTAQEVITAFKLYVQEEAKRYEKEFPDELYIQWHRLYDIPVLERGKSWHFKHLTVKHIYFPLAQSNGRILELVRALKARDGDRKKKLFQFLSEVGARALRIQLGRVLEMSESSVDKVEYEKKITDRFGTQKELELVLPSTSDIQNVAK